MNRASWRFEIALRKEHNDKYDLFIVSEFREVGVEVQKHRIEFGMILIYFMSRCEDNRTR